MDTKRRMIMETAMRLFSEKGYHTTSVQEIAKECGISKGSLYKYFASKEDLYIEVFEFYQNQMLEKAACVSGATKKEKLVNQMIVQVEDFLEKKDFIEIQFKELPNEKFVSLMKRTQSKMMHWYKTSIEEAFGDEVKPFIWDIVIMHKGMLKEFVLLLTKENIHFSVKKLAEYLVERLDDLITSMKKQPSPLLTNDQMSSFNITMSKEERLSDLFQHLKNTISQLGLQAEYKQDLFNAVELLIEEIHKEHVKRFLVYSLLSYLEKEKDLLVYTEKVKKFIEVREE
jgi:AcrR family transcriptional regulator